MRFKLSAVVIPVILAIVLAGPLAAQVELNPNHPETYTVRRGDTLWEIAGRFLRQPWRWSEIWDANREIGNPNLIYPGDVLRLYYRNGQPRVGFASGMRTVKLSPRVRVSALEMPVPTVSVGTIRPFITRPYVLDRKQIDDAPYVVSLPDKRVLGGTGDRLYVRSILRNSDERFHVVRPGEPYKDPETGDALGYKALFIADAVMERAGDPAALRISSMELETVVGDRVLPTSSDEPLQTFYPRPGPPGRRGRIISVLNGVSQIGLHNVVVLNLGSREGIEPGHVFDIYNGGEIVKDRVGADAARWNWKSMKFWSEEFWYGDYRTDRWLENEPDPNEPFPLHRGASSLAEDYVLPYERAGTLMVFRTFDRVSFALVMRATRAMHVLDTVSPPRT
jgi:hypothetical protein